MSDEPLLPEPTRRLVLLGASNLTRAIGTVVATAGTAWNEPLDVLAAMGFGRSYGMRTALLVRGLPSILGCGLWQAMRERPELPTTALITDIGNDVLYHAPPAQIADWVRQCVDRLERFGARVVITQLPVCNFAALARWRYLFFRTVFMPMCRLPRDETVERATDLNERVEQLARERGIPLIEQNPAWYGLDPIHIRRAHWPVAWGKILLPMMDNGATIAAAQRAAWFGVRLQAIAPDERSLFRATFRRAQPALACRNGTRISIF